MFNGDVKKIKEDLAALKPNVFISVPRLYNKFYQKIKGDVGALTGCKSWLANKAIASKMATEEKSGAFTHFLYDRLIFNKMKAVLGGRVKFLLTGSAPISVEVMRFLKICFCADFLVGYGQTEGCGATFVSHTLEKKVANSVGGPTLMVEYKLINVPEMNYLVTNKDE